MIFQLLDAIICIQLSFPSFECKRDRDDSDCEDPQFPGYLCDHRSRPRACPTTQTGSNEEHLGPFLKNIPDVICILQCRVPAD